MKLADLTPGESGTIIRVDDPRLEEMGLRIGNKITCLHGHIYKCEGIKWSITRGIAIEIS